MEFNWNFQRGVGVLIKYSFHGEGMDIFWDYVFRNKSYLKIVSYRGNKS